MGLLHIYNTISNEHSEINRNGKLKNVLADLNYNNYIAVKEGNRIDGEYEIKDNDVLYLRLVPTSTVALAVVSIVMGVLAVGVGIGSAIYAKKQSDEAKKQMEKAQRDANNLAQTITQLPFVRGGKNRNALGNVVQYVLGDVYNTPYALTDGFYTVSGEKGKDLYYNAIFSLGYGSQKVKKVMIGEENIITNNDGINGVNSFDSGSLYYDANNVVEVAHSGADFQTSYFKNKVVCTLDQSEIKHDYGKDAVPVIKQLANNTQKVELAIQFNGLRQYNTSSSVWEKCGVNITAEWSNNGGATWSPLTWNCSPQTELKKMTTIEVIVAKQRGEIDSSGNPTVTTIVKVGSDYYKKTSNTFQFYENTNQTIRFTAEKVFSASEAYGKNISIRLTRTNAKHESNSTEDAYLIYYQSYCYDPEKSSTSSLVACKTVESKLMNTERLGLRIIANDSTNGQLEEIHALTTGCARVFSGNTLGSSRVPTRNPSAWLLEILTSDTHKHSKYELNEIDLNSFATLYSYCNTMNFYTDGIITSNTKKQDLISEILATVNADLIINADGKLEVVIDKEEATPVALINSENVKSTNYAKSLEIAPTGARVMYIDRNTWQPNTVTIMKNGGNPTENDKLTDYNLNYITTYEHIYKYVQRRLREQALQPYTITVDVGREGDYYPLYSTVLLQLQQFRQGITSSVITGLTISNNNYITDITISDLVDFDDSSRYGLTIQAQTDGGTKQYNVEVSGTGSTRTLHLVTAINNTGIAPVVGNIVSFGYLNDDGTFTKVTKKMKIYGIEPNGNEGYSLTLKEYNEAVYQFGTIPDYVSNLTVKPQSRNKSASLEDIQKAESQLIEALQNRNITIRNLINLQAEGYENEVATYGGNLYIYLGGVWEPVQTSNYMGEYGSNLPESITTGAYFYATNDFINFEPLQVNNDFLEINNEPLYIAPVKFKGGYIYVYNGVTWVQITDPNNFRYLSTFSQNVKHVPTYLGIMNTDPVNAKKGDWFAYGGTTTAQRKNGYIYLYNGETWGALDPSDSTKTAYFMSALNDILKTDAIASQNIGYFNVIFANAIFSSSAAIGTLQTKTIELQNGGVIKSSNFVSGSSGFKIDGDTGAAEFGDGYFRGVLGSKKTLPVYTNNDGNSYIIWNISADNLENNIIQYLITYETSGLLGGRSIICYGVGEFTQYSEQNLFIKGFSTMTLEIYSSGAAPFTYRVLDIEFNRKITPSEVTVNYIILSKD